MQLKECSLKLDKFYQKKKEAKALKAFSRMHLFSNVSSLKIEHILLLLIYIQDTPLTNSLYPDIQSFNASAVFNCSKKIYLPYSYNIIFLLFFLNGNEKLQKLFPNWFPSFVFLFTHLLYLNVIMLLCAIQAHIKT